VGDAGLGDVLHLAHQEVVPSSVLLPRLPVEALTGGSKNSGSVQTTTAPIRVTSDNDLNSYYLKQDLPGRRVGRQANKGDEQSH